MSVDVNDECASSFHISLGPIDPCIDNSGPPFPSFVSFGSSAASSSVPPPAIPPIPAPITITPRSPPHAPTQTVDVPPPMPQRHRTPSPAAASSSVRRSTRPTRRTPPQRPPQPHPHPTHDNLPPSDFFHTASASSSSSLPFSRPTHPSILIPYEGVFFSLPIDNLDISIELNLSTAFVRLCGRWKNIAAYESDVLFVLPISGTVSSCQVCIGEERTMETVMLPIEEVKKITEEQKRRKKEKDTTNATTTTATTTTESVHANSSNKQNDETILAQGQLPPMSFDSYIPNLFRLPISNVGIGEWITVTVIYIESAEFKHHINDGAAVAGNNVRSNPFVDPNINNNVHNNHNTNANNTNIDLRHHTTMDESCHGYYHFTLPLTFSSTLILPDPQTGLPRTVNDILHLRTIINSIDTSPASASSTSSSSSSSPRFGRSSNVHHDMQWWSPTHHMQVVDDTFPRCELVVLPRQERILVEDGKRTRYEFGSPSILQRSAYQQQQSHHHPPHTHSNESPLASIDWTICYTMSSEVILPSCIMEITQQEVLKPNLTIPDPSSSTTTPSTTTIDPSLERRQQLLIEEEGNFLLFVTPPAVENVDSYCNRRMVFLIDRSGSMVGDSYTEACRALLVAISQLRESDRFTICAFDHTQEWLSHELIPVTTSTLMIAQKWLFVTQPQGGGTDIFGPLERSIKHLKELEQQDRLEASSASSSASSAGSSYERSQSFSGTSSLHGSRSTAPRHHHREQREQSKSHVHSPHDVVVPSNKDGVDTSEIQLSVLGLTPNGQGIIQSSIPSKDHTNTNTNANTNPRPPRPTTPTPSETTSTNTTNARSAPSPPTNILSFIILLTDGCVANEKEICFFTHRQLGTQRVKKKNNNNKMKDGTTKMNGGGGKGKDASLDDEDEDADGDDDKYDDQSHPPPSTNIRICTLGIGSYCNWYFLKMLSQLGRGFNDIIQYRERIYSQVLTLIDHTTSLPVLTDITLEMDDTCMSDLSIYPYPIPDLYMGAPLTLSAKYRGRLPDELRLTGRHADGTIFTSTITPRISHVIPVVKVFLKQRLDCLTASAWLDGNDGPSINDKQRNTNNNNNTSSDVDPHQKVRDEIIKLSCTYNFSSAYTSMVLYSTNAITKSHAPSSSSVSEDVTQQQTPTTTTTTTTITPLPSITSSFQDTLKSSPRLTVQEEMDLAHARAQMALGMKEPTGIKWYHDPRKIIALAAAEAIVLGTAAFSFGNLGGTNQNFPGFGGGVGGEFRFEPDCCSHCGECCHQCEFGVACFR